MKRVCLIAMTLVMMLALLCGCKSNEGADLNQVTGGAGGEIGVGNTGDFNDFLEDEDPSQPPSAQTPDEEQPSQEEQPGDTPGGATGEEEQPPSQPPEEETPSEEPTKEPVDYTTDDWITVCSYNVKVLYYDDINNANGSPMSKFEAVCDELRKIDADVVGLQELDRFSSRCGAQVDQLKELADALGYPYYYYTKTVPSDVGEYGHGIMSRYPILSSKSYYFADYPGNIDAAEPRGFSRSELKVGNKALVFYNTHLAGHQDMQMLTITMMMEKDMQRGKYAVLTGDMNAYPSSLAAGVGDDCIQMNTVEAPQNTTYQMMLSGKVNPIDNIVVTSNLEHYWDDAKKTGLIVVQTNASDHLPIYTYVRMKT